nr:hypothetical protein BACY1_21050 [Tenacibaculum mesophilum]
MKTRFIAFLALLIFTTTSNAQRKLTTDKLQIKETELGVKSDSILVIGSKGNVKHILQSQLAPPVTIPTLQQVAAEGNVTDKNVILKKAGGNSTQSIVFDSDGFDIEIGQSTTSNRGVYSTDFFIKYDGTNVFTVNGNKDAIFSGYGSFTSGYSQVYLKSAVNGFYGALTFPSTTTGNRTYSLPDKDITFAGLSDIPIKANFYAQGDFIPILDDTSASTPFTYDIEKAIYKRVGNTVFYEIRLTNINGTASGAARIKNLPATVEPQSITYSNVGRLLGSSMSNIEKVSAQVDFTQGGGISLIAKDTDVFNSNITFTNGVLYISGSYPTNVYTP